MGMYGIDFDRPISHLREYLDDRADAARRRTRRARGRALPRERRSSTSPTRPPPPVMLGVLREQSARLAGGHADGALCWLCPADYLQKVIAPNLARRRGRGRSPRAAADRRAAVRAHDRPRRGARDGRAGSRRVPAHAVLPGDLRSGRHRGDRARVERRDDRRIGALRRRGRARRQDPGVLRRRCRRGGAVTVRRRRRPGRRRRPTASECSATWQGVD